jgi:hypothetical protein
VSAQRDGAGLAAGVRLHVTASRPSPHTHITRITRVTHVTHTTRITHIARIPRITRITPTNTRSALVADGRNFHAWNYRQFIVKLTGTPPEQELRYTAERIGGACQTRVTRCTRDACAE